MKKRFLNYSLNLIRKNRPEIDEIHLDEIRYGLEGFYLTFSKAIVIFTLSLILGIFKEMILMLIFFNILRSTGFGLHASKSWICLLSSIIIFVFLPFLALHISIPLIWKDILGIIAIILVYYYAPADTIKRPIISQIRRNYYKAITTISTIILVYIMLFIQNNIISNLILFGIYTEIAVIVPLSYKIFHLNYNNYLNYIPD